MAQTFLDIETVPQWATWDEVPIRVEEVFRRKFGREIDDLKMEIVTQGLQETMNNFWRAKAALHAEWGKVIAVSVGIIHSEGTKLRIKGIAPHGKKDTDGKDISEIVLLQDLAVTLGKINSIAGHNIKEFDVPFLDRRFMIHGIEIPKVLDRRGVKPWDDLNEDTVQIWGFNQFKYYSSLETLATIFGLPSSKTEMDGSLVADYFYSEPAEGVLPWDHKEEVMQKISKYCNGDLVTTANVYQKMMRKPIFTAENIEYVQPPAQQSI